MNVTLINVPDSDVYQKFKRPEIKNLPLGLAYIAGSLEKAEHNVTIVDGCVEQMSIDGIVEKVLNTNPELVGTSATTPVISNALEVLEKIKWNDPSIATVIGGPHISATASQTISDNTNVVDFAVVGEGENTILEIIDYLDGNRDLEHIDGLVYFTKGAICKGNSRKLIDDLDTIPFPARHLFDVGKYVNAIRFDGTKPPISLTSSRGCFGKCTFCGSQTTWGRKVRFRSPQNIIDEIKYCHKNYGSTSFIFVDDTFTANRKHVIDTCKLIIKLPFQVEMFCSSRVDTIDDEKLDWLKQAGCDCITYGIESGDTDILKIMKKNTTVDMIRKAVDITKGHRIKTHGSFILGNFGDTHDTINATVDLAINLGLDQAQFTVLIPLPGTECYEQAIEFDRFKCEPEDFKSFFWYYSVVANMTDGVTDEELLNYQKEAYRKFRLSKSLKLGDI
jgi:anaerobic magnesium-protoporphyrin IX monomethyl ester cyclase